MMQAIRCVHESELHEENSFITLTYDDEHLPEDLSLEPKHLQDFWKRFRDRISPRRIRYFACGEYGAVGSRPHYHACVFGFAFSDRVFFKHGSGGQPVYRSGLLEDLWKFGHSSVGNVTFESAAYVARYVMKKEFGKDAGLRRAILDVTTGELIFRRHEFSRVSNGSGSGGAGGLGKRWLERFTSDVYPHGRVVMNGREVKPPRYYDQWFKAQNPEGFERLAADRQAAADARFDDNAPSRLRAREEIFKARVSFLKREL